MDRVGLCAHCQHARVIESGRGSRFYLCTAAQRDPRLRKYPPLPVLSCFAYEPNQPTP
ncbi:MAG: hypothetical protein QM778_01425 [Myxococcales bacterium]